MDRVSRPLLALLISTLAFFALWVTMLRGPGGSSSASSSAGLGTFNHAIAAAHGAVASSNSTSAAPGGTASQSHASGAASRASTLSPVAHLPAVGRHARTTASSQSTGGLARQGLASALATEGEVVQARLGGLTGRAPASAQATEAEVVQAIEAHQVVAMLFYNPAGADDRTVRGELAAVPGRGGQVLKVAVPLSQLTRYPAVSAQVPVVTSPTLVVIDRHGQATIVQGFADGFEIAQRIDDALAS